VRIEWERIEEHTGALARADTVVAAAIGTWWWYEKGSSCPTCLHVNAAPVLLTDQTISVTRNAVHPL
jgi:hypothetical protein